MVRSYIALLAALCALLLAACAAPAATDNAAIAAAALAELEATTGVEIDEVRVEEVVGDFARAVAVPVDTISTDQVTVFLQREGADWRILNYGTAFSPEDYEQLGIPEELWLGQ